MYGGGEPHHPRSRSRHCLANFSAGKLGRRRRGDTARQYLLKVTCVPPTRVGFFRAHLEFQPVRILYPDVWLLRLKYENYSFGEDGGNASPRKARGSKLSFSRFSLVSYRSYVNCSATAAWNFSCIKRVNIYLPYSTIKHVNMEVQISFNNSLYLITEWHTCNKFCFSFQINFTRDSQFLVCRRVFPSSAERYTFLDVVRKKSSSAITEINSVSTLRILYVFRFRLVRTSSLISNKHDSFAKETEHVRRGVCQSNSSFLQRAIPVTYDQALVFTSLDPYYPISAAIIPVLPG